MPYFTPDDTQTVNLITNPDYWVKISAELHWKDAKSFVSFQDNDASYALDKLLQTLIVEWNLDDGEGNILPITSENIDRLKRADAEALITAVGAVVEKETPAQKKSS